MTSRQITMKVKASCRRKVAECITTKYPNVAVLPPSEDGGGSERQTVEFIGKVSLIPLLPHLEKIDGTLFLTHLEPTPVSLIPLLPHLEKIDETLFLTHLEPTPGTNCRRITIEMEGQCLEKVEKCIKANFPNVQVQSTVEFIGEVDLSELLPLVLKIDGTLLVTHVKTIPGETSGTRHDNQRSVTAGQIMDIRLKRAENTIAGLEEQIQRLKTDTKYLEDENKISRDAREKEKRRTSGNK